MGTAAVQHTVPNWIIYPTRSIMVPICVNYADFDAIEPQFGSRAITI